MLWHPDTPHHPARWSPNSKAWTPQSQDFTLRVWFLGVPSGTNNYSDQCPTGIMETTQIFKIKGPEAAPPSWREATPKPETCRNTLASPFLLPSNFPYSLFPADNRGWKQVTEQDRGKMGNGSGHKQAQDWQLVTWVISVFCFCCLPVCLFFNVRVTVD